MPRFWAGVHQPYTRPVKTHGPRCRLETMRDFFEHDHVHMALVVAADGRLITTIERSDLAGARAGTRCAAELGTLVGRTVVPWQGVAAARETLLRQGRRRLAVIDGSGRLLGLLCSNRLETGRDRILFRRRHPRAG
jgi:CBS-domain-containing membrane protein